MDGWSFMVNQCCALSFIKERENSNRSPCMTSSCVTIKSVTFSCSFNRLSKSRIRSEVSLIPERTARQREWLGARHCLWRGVVIA